MSSNLSTAAGTSNEAVSIPATIAEVCAVPIIETDIFDVKESPDHNTDVSSIVTHTDPATSAQEYPEDLIDFEDDEPAPASNDSGDKSGDNTRIGFDNADLKLEEETVEITGNSMVKEQIHDPKSEQTITAQRLEQAKYAMSLGPHTLLSSSPDIASALQLHDIGDTVTVNVSINGVTYDISWTVAAKYGEEQQPTMEQSTMEQPTTGLTTKTARRKTSLRDAPPLSSPPGKYSNPHTATKCKFGRTCNKGAACPFDHTIKLRLCTRVNTAYGCTKNTECEFSHENEGVKCTRSTTRYGCANGKGCAFKHLDDMDNVYKVKAAVASIEQRRAAENTPRNVPAGPKTNITPRANVPTGPKKITQQQVKTPGQKRSRDDDDTVNATQRKRPNNNTGNFNAGSYRGVKQHRGHARGNGRAGGSERSGVVAGGEFSIKGAATGDNWRGVSR